jgi:prepilin-type N-terminal cleavage/methylation domain-containing protein
MRRGFTLIEVMFASGVAAIGLLTLLGALLSVKQASLKTADSERASALADQIIERTVREVARRDNEAFWTAPEDTPWKTGEEGDYHYEVTSQPILARSGGALGQSTGATDNVLRRVRVKVWWWSAQPGSRQGYGQLQVNTSRLINRTRIGD